MRSHITVIAAGISVLFLLMGPRNPGITQEIDDRPAYRVNLHIAEIFYRERGQRSFSVLLEGKPVLESYEPLAAGFSKAETRSFEVDVTDGFLDIEFRHGGADNPKISAISIERIR